MNPIGDDTVAMDRCHIQLIAALVGALKPKAILELGYGSGRLTRALTAARDEWQLGAYYQLVDSWLDFGGEPTLDLADLRGKVNIITSTEEDYVKWAIQHQYHFDLIVSDADHHRAHEWAVQVYDKMLNPGGILIYHDVDGTYPGLASLPDVFKALWGASVKVFNKTSLHGERCGRGLLVVFKPEVG